MKGIKAVLFDLDETLMDAQAASRVAHGRVIDKLMDFLAKRGDNVERKKIEAELEKLEREKQVKRDYDRDRWWQELVERVELKPLEDHQLKELTALYWDSYSEASEPFPDAEPLLDYLKKKGYRLGMVTDTDGTPGRKWARISHLSVMKYFETVIVAGEETPLPKPDPQPFLIVASRLGVKPEECVMIGDKPYTDIRGAKNAGMKTIRVFRREWHNEEEADFTVHSLAEVMDIL
ncbi:MAG: TIGR02253 family HAD-type hydrolase [Candidatus Hadarchaeales archaeon]